MGSRVSAAVRTARSARSFKRESFVLHRIRRLFVVRPDAKTQAREKRRTRRGLRVRKRYAFQSRSTDEPHLVERAKARRGE